MKRLLGSALAAALTLAAPVAAQSLQPWAGGAAPGFALPDLAGQRHELASLAGRPLIVNFFATWCEPCLSELPALQRLAAAADGPAVVAIDVGEPADRVRRLAARLAIDFPVLLDEDRAVLKAWKIAMLPTSIVLDRKLVPRLYAEGAIDWMAEAGRLAKGGTTCIDAPC